MQYRIKNWTEFQHYKDRLPPWIKLHNSLLTSEAWVMTDDASRALLIACMLLASRNSANDGTFNGEPEYVKRFAYLNKTPDFKPLIQYGFIEPVQDASNVLAECNTEERREEKNKDRYSPSAHLLSLGVEQPLIDDFMKVRKAKKAPLTETAVKAIIRESQKAGWSVSKAIQRCCEKGWQSFNADWVKEDSSPPGQSYFAGAV